MDATRFDAITKALIAGTCWRWAGSSVGTFALLGLADPEGGAARTTVVPDKGC